MSQKERAKEQACSASAASPALSGVSEVLIKMDSLRATPAMGNLACDEPRFAGTHLGPWWLSRQWLWSPDSVSPLPCTLYPVPAMLGV